MMYAAGRASEPSYMTWEDTSWDHHFKCGLGVIPMSKTSKTKYIALISGPGRYMDVFLHIGDYLALRESPDHSPEETCARREA